MEEENYNSRKKVFLKAFDKLLTRARPHLVNQFGEQQADRIIQESRQEYDALIPHLPFIGNSNLKLMFFLPTTRLLPVYRVLQRLGLSLEESGRLIYLIGSEEGSDMSPIVRRLMAYLWFSSLFSSLARNRALHSQKRTYAPDFVINFVEGDGQTFDYGADYIECANCKLLKDEQAFELAPFICATDYRISERLGWGLIRTMTLAEGYPKCDFRFKKGGPTRVTMPEALLEFT